MYYANIQVQAYFMILKISSWGHQSLDFKDHGSFGIASLPSATRHEFFLGVWILEPLHTRAKSRDHEIVRAQKKVSKGHRPKRPPQPCSVVTLKCSVKSYVPEPSTKCYFNELLFMQALTHDNI